MSCSIVFCGVESDKFLTCANSHSIHKQCARSWAEKVPNNFSCPLCRTKIPIREVLSQDELEVVEVLEQANRAIALADRAIAEERSSTEFYTGLATLVAVTGVWKVFAYWIEGNF